MTEPEYVYGWGRTKHIRDRSGTKRNAYRVYDPGEPVALCGAYGGYYREEPQRPVCKHCARIAKRES